MTNYTWPTITKNTPLSKIKKIHRRIWNYVIKHGEKPKTRYASDCVLCEYNQLCGLGCKNCLVKWSVEKCYMIGSVYYLWNGESDPEKKRLLAQQIRDIEFKEKSQKIPRI